MTASRLYRLANPTRVPMFQVENAQLGHLRDDVLHSIKITRGTDEPMPGLSPTVVEFSTRGAVWPAVNSTTHVRLTDDYMAASGLPAGCRERAMKLRVGTYETEDRGDGRRFTTTLQAVHWSALLNTAARKLQPVASAWVDSLVVSALNHPDLNTRYNVAAAATPVDEFGITGEWTATPDVLDKWGAGHGMLLREKRTGDLEVVNLDRRRAEVDAAMATTLPILRRQGIAPARWHQTAEAGTVQYSITRRTAENNVEYTQDWPLPAGAEVARVQPRLVDWSDTRTYTEQYRHYMNARNYASNYPENSLAAVRVDVAHLIRSAEPYDRALVRQLLALEVGAPVFLSGDWPGAVRGRYFAQQITEEITPAGWTLELALQPGSRVVGYNYDESQQLPVYTWGQLAALRPSQTWGTDTTSTWGSFALPTT